LGTLEPLHTLNLSNGLLVSIYDQTTVYFGDYYHVRVKIICSLHSGASVWKQLCPENAVLQSVAYTRILEKMAVPSEDVECVKKSLLNDFDRNSLPYISSAGFPKKMIDNELRSRKLPARNYQGAGS